MKRLKESHISGNGKTEQTKLRITALLFVLVAFLTLAINYGSRGAFGLFLKPLGSEFGASRGTVSSILSINMIVYACVAFFTGYLNDRLGPRIVLLMGGGLAGVSFLISAASSTLFQMTLSYGMMYGVATCMLSQITAVSLLMKSPNETSSLAVGILGSGPGIGNITLVPIIAAILTRSNWSLAMNVMGMLFLLYILAPLFFLRKTDKRSHLDRAGLSFQDTKVLLKKPNILLMFCSFFLMCVGIYGVLSQEAAYATDRGFSLAEAGWALGLINGAGVVFSPIIGGLSDRVASRKRFGAILILMGIAGIFFIFIAGTWAFLALGSIFVGICYCSYMPIFPSIVRSHVGKDFFGRVWGFISMGGSIGAAIGCGIGGFVYDLWGNYSLLWLFIAICFLLASICLALVGPKDLEQGI